MIDNQIKLPSQEIVMPKDFLCRRAVLGFIERFLLFYNAGKISDELTAPFHFRSGYEDKENFSVEIFFENEKIYIALEANQPIIKYFSSQGDLIGTQDLKSIINFFQKSIKNKKFPYFLCFDMDLLLTRIKGYINKEEPYMVPTIISEIQETSNTEISYDIRLYISCILFAGLIMFEVCSEDSKINDFTQGSQASETRKD